MIQEPPSIEKAMQADGFVNFYSILGATPATLADELQESINAMYQEAQTHRDHRIPARRRESQLLLEVLPQARTILLDEARRKRYNAYCNAVEMGAPRVPFPEFFSSLMREKEADEARSDILTLRDLSRLRIAAPEAPSDAETPHASQTLVTPEVSNTAPSGDAPSASIQLPKQVPAAANGDFPNTSPSPATRFSSQSLGCGFVVLCGLLVCLPAMAGVSLILSAPLAAISAGVTAYVFSIADNEVKT